VNFIRQVSLGAGTSWASIFIFQLFQLQLLQHFGAREGREARTILSLYYPSTVGNIGLQFGTRVGARPAIADLVNRLQLVTSGTPTVTRERRAPSPYSYRFPQGERERERESKRGGGRDLIRKQCP